MYDIPIGTENVHEENKEDNGDVVYQESECIGVNATVQQENDEDLTLLHRDDVPAIDLGNLIPVDDVYVQLDESYVESTSGGSSSRHKRDQKRAQSHSFFQLDGGVEVDPFGMFVQDGAVEVDPLGMFVQEGGLELVPKK
ncbi:hypothetical protein CMV_012939 [Castanea mollissima]|uniref:Uncharacterized protein n=1 Tax=Castanea mollissima TaxID=60419 RepID=A0A8J4VIP1_9ROSI|nr:hypothetical protein CMV_012939 [Castanea mollissima]